MTRLMALVLGLALKQPLHRQVGAMDEPLRLSKDQLMDAEARTMLHRFVRSLNQDTPHPLDWQRFHDFIIHVHGLERAYRVDELRAILTEEGLTREKACRFVSAYEDGLAVLRRYDEQAH